MKEVLFIRHSKAGKCPVIYSKYSLQKQNEKKSLTRDGIILAKNKFQDKVFNNIEEIYTSNYTRAVKTAKILASKNNLKIIIKKEFSERKIGIKSWDEYPKDFEIHQFNDNDYKLPQGESLNEVRNREYKALLEILENTKTKKIAIVFHSTAMMILLKTWCNISYDSDYYFNDKQFFDGKWNYCETFKLIFDDNNDLISIENIRDE